MTNPLGELISKMRIWLLGVTAQSIQSLGQKPGILRQKRQQENSLLFEISHYLSLN